MSDKEKMIEKIKETVLNTAPDSEVYLYGSQARETNHSSSDWDLLVLLHQNKISFDFETKFMDDFYELELLTGAVISPLIYSKTDWDKIHLHSPLFENIQKDGIRIL
jgi:predicted nucleotidyltransferase